MISGARSSSSSPSSCSKVDQRCNNNSISSTSSNNISNKNRNRRDSNSCQRSFKSARRLSSQQDDTDSSSSMGPARGNVKKRDMANKRERERTKSLNRALEILRDRLPVPEAEKRSKIQTLRMAKEYIIFLRRLSQNHEHQNHQVSQQQHTYQHYPQFESPLNIAMDHLDPRQREAAGRLVAFKRQQGGTKLDAQDDIDVDDLDEDLEEEEEEGEEEGDDGENDGMAEFKSSHGRMDMQLNGQTTSAHNHNHQQQQQQQQHNS